MIVFSPGVGTAIERVSAAGGVPATVTKLEVKDELDRYPSFLPDKKHFLYLTSVGKPEFNGINVGSLDGSQPVHILSDASNSAFVSLEESVFWPSAVPTGGHVNGRAIRCAPASDCR